MSVLPSPVPHPLEFSPFDVPGWAYGALEWVVGFDWPAGNEVTTWNVADRWYALAAALAEPNDAALAAARRVLSGYGGAGITADGFDEAWRRVGGDENAPLNDLLRIADELGALVEECGRDIEAAKLEAWIEIGIFLIELIGMTITVALTLGAASPAAGGLIMATRIAIQRIFRRLVEQLGRKAMKQTAGRAIKQVTSRQGLRRLGREALDEGFDEAREELATNGGIQLYQQSNGRRDDFAWDDLGRSAAAGFAGGAASSGAGVGAHGHGGGVVRGAGGEVLAEFGSAAVFGELPDATGVAKAATSGAAGSALSSPVDIGSLTLGDGPASPGTPVGAGSFVAGEPAIEVSGVSADGFVASTGAESSSDPGTASSAGDSAVGGSSLGTSPQSQVAAPAGPDAGSTGESATGPTSSSAASSPADASLAASPADFSLATSSSADFSSAASSSADFSPAASSSADFSPGASSSAATPSVVASEPASSSLASPSMATSDSTAPSTAPLLATSDSASATLTPPALAVPDISPSVGPALSSGQPDGTTVLANSAPTALADPVPGPSSAAATPASPSPTPGQPGYLPLGPSARRAATGPPPGAHRDDRPHDPGAVRRSPLSDLDRIAEALGPRPTPQVRTLPLPLDVTTARIPRQRDRSTASQPRVIAAPLPDDLDKAPRRSSTPAPPPIRDEGAYFGYAEHARHTYELNRRDDYIRYLASIADDNRRKIVDLGRRADEAARAGATLRADEDRRLAYELSGIVAEIETQTEQIRSGDLAPERVEVDPPDWARINRDVGNLAPGGVHTDDRSALTGSGGRSPIDRTRHYHTVGGLRPPLAVHQTDLEEAVPRRSDGRAARLPDPRVGRWFRLANDGGPSADPTRGLNCVDGVLALFDTYVHGRPRVSAPRTFDTYAHGNPDRPLGGEVDGVDRIRQATGGDFQALCPNLAGTDPAQAKAAMDTAVGNLTNHLHNSGHGSYAFIVTDLEGGGSHSWAAVNHHGTVLYLDPQISRVSEELPMYRHHGVPSPTNIISLEALVVTADAEPAPLPYHGPGAWSATPTGADFDDADAIRAAERQAFASLEPEEQATLRASLEESEVVAARVSADLHAVTEAFGESARIVDEEHRVKSVASLGRKYLEAVETDDVDVEQYLSKVKDRVRLSVETAESDYGVTVSGVLAGLERLGYRTTQMANFWADHGRHNGLNVWLLDPSGFRIEIQFPTPLSRQAGKATHHSYEVMRLGSVEGYKRVDAFLDILAVNKRMELHDHRPSDLHLISGARPKDTTLAAWLRSDPEAHDQYRQGLAERGLSFEQDLQRHGLTLSDVPGTDEMGLFE